jgi:hypothetical protein
VVPFLDDIVSIGPYTTILASLLTLAGTMRTRIGSNRTGIGKNLSKGSAETHKGKQSDTFTLNNTVYLYCTKRLVRPMDHNLILYHKVSRLFSDDKVSEEDRTYVKSHPSIASLLVLLFILLAPSLVKFPSDPKWTTLLSEQVPIPFPLPSNG